MKFQYIGDQDRQVAEKVPAGKDEIGNPKYKYVRRTQKPDNPDTITMYGFTFERDGAPVDIKAGTRVDGVDVCAKLRGNVHFREVRDTKKAGADGDASAD